jgi:hypothetical protein
MSSFCARAYRGSSRRPLGSGRSATRDWRFDNKGAFMSIRRSVIFGWGVCMLGAITSSALADGAPPGRHEAAMQVVKCMKKRMAADRYLSYNQAARDCRAYVRRGTAPGSELLAADQTKSR